MSDRTLRISRRKLLKMSGFAPIAALIAAGASPAEVAQAIVGVPNEVAEDLLQKAKDNKHDPEPKFFKAIAKILWQFVEAGAEMGDKPVPSNLSKKRELAKHAYDQPTGGKKSGNLIIASLVDWRDSDVTNWDTIQSATLGCAYLTGFYAAKWAAGEHGNGVFDKDAYTAGFKQTEAQMKSTMMRIKRSDPQAKRNLLAAGCG